MSIDFFEGTYTLRFEDRDQFNAATKALADGHCPFVADIGYADMIVILENHDPDDLLSASRILGGLPGGAS